MRRLVDGPDEVGELARAHVELRALRALQPHDQREVRGGGNYAGDVALQLAVGANVRPQDVREVREARRGGRREARGDGGQQLEGGAAQGVQGGPAGAGQGVGDQQGKALFDGGAAALGGLEAADAAGEGGLRVGGPGLGRAVDVCR